MQHRPPFSSLSNRQRVRLVVAYDGSDFCGWAAQRDRRTVHGTLTEAVRLISGEEIEITGASRTDSGAHARGQVCHFDASVSMPAENWKKALNDRLPSDVAIVQSSAVDSRFNSRFWANWRHYRYRIQIGERDPQRSRFVHLVSSDLDLKAMQIAAKALVGTNDYERFSQALDSRANTVRHLFKVNLSRVRDEIHLNVRGTAFVRGMMRRIAGCLLEVGSGRESADYARLLIEAAGKKKPAKPPVLPASGLCLMKISYGRHPSDKRPNDRTADKT